MAYKICAIFFFGGGGHPVYNVNVLCSCDLVLIPLYRYEVSTIRYRTLNISYC